MRVTKYASHIASENAVQYMEFVYFEHLLLCMDLTNRKFHFLYHHKNPGEYFMDDLKGKHHDIAKLEDIQLCMEGDQFNDLRFALYEGESFGLAVFDGLMVIGYDNGLYIVERPDINAQKLPPDDILEEFDIYDLDHNDATIQCNIPQNDEASLALKMEALDYRIFAEIYRCPGEPIDFYQRIEELQMHYDLLCGYFSTIYGLKRNADCLCVDDADTSELASSLQEITDSLGVDLALFDDDGKPKRKG